VQTRYSGIYSELARKMMGGVVSVSELKLRKYKKRYYLADSLGLIIVKDLTLEQVIQIQNYFIKKKKKS